MKTTVILDEIGDTVADNLVLVYAQRNIGKTVTIGTLTMLTAFRILKMRGTISELIIQFEDGTETRVNSMGRLDYWPNTGITCVMEQLAYELVHG